MWSDPKDGRVLGGILAVIGACVLFLYLWGRFEDGEGNTSLLIGASTIIFAGLLLTQYKSKKGEDDAG